MQVTDEMVEAAYAAWDGYKPTKSDVSGYGAMRAALTAALDAMWRPIEDLTRENDHQRILVAGWQNPTKRVAGYWWWHEDSVVEGAPFEHPQATFWCLAHFSLPSSPKKEA